MDPYEAYHIAKKTLEKMDEFAGPVNGNQRTLPGCLQFPSRIFPNPYQPQVLKKIPMSTSSNTFEQHTEKDDNPNMPHYSLSYEIQDFQDEDNISTKPMGHFTYDNFYNSNSERSDEEYDDDDWNLLSMRKQLSKIPQIKKPEPVPVPIPVVEKVQEPETDNCALQDQELLAQIRRDFGFSVTPYPVYRNSSLNPLFFDDI